MLAMRLRNLLPCEHFIEPRTGGAAGPPKGLRVPCESAGDVALLPWNRTFGPLLSPLFPLLFQGCTLSTCVSFQWRDV